MPKTTVKEAPLFIELRDPFGGVLASWTFREDMVPGVVDKTTLYEKLTEEVTRIPFSINGGPPYYFAISRKLR
jgi:hypothetical protein